MAIFMQVTLLNGESDTKIVTFYKDQHKLINVGKSEDCEWCIRDLKNCDRALMLCWDGKVLSVLELQSGVALLDGLPLRGHATNLEQAILQLGHISLCLLYTSPSPRDATLSRMPSSA